MSTKQGKIRGHKLHGDPNRFQELADYIAQNYVGKVERIADVAGGQGMLYRILRKKYNFDCEVIDPRGYTLVGVQSRAEEYKADMADYYDLIVGLHPDEALKEVVYSALVRPVILIPCCNFWTREKKLGRDALLDEIEAFYKEHGVNYKKVIFDFEGPKNIGLVSQPPMTNKKTEYQKYLEEVHSRSTIPDDVLNQVVIDTTGSPIAEKERILKGEANGVYDVRTQKGGETFVRIERRGPGFLQEKWAIDQCKKIGVPVPEVLGIQQLTLADEQLVICIQKKIEGDTLERGGINVDEMDRERLRKIINQAGAILAKIHSIPTQGFDRINERGVGKFKTFKDMMLDREAERDEYAQLAKRIDLNPQVAERAMRVLAKHQDLYEGVKSCLNHGDFGPKHIMVDEDKITGILDWGEAQGNSPVYDITKWDYWFGDWIPTEWLKEGYTDKSIFDENFDLLTRLIHLRSGLILIYWYDEFKYPRGVERAKERLLKDLEVFN